MNCKECDNYQREDIGKAECLNFKPKSHLLDEMIEDSIGGEKLKDGSIIVPSEITVSSHDLCENMRKLRYESIKWAWTYAEGDLNIFLESQGHKDWIV